MRRILPLFGLLVCGGAWAQAGDPREQVIDMATIVAAHDLCGFDLPDTAEDTIAKRRQALVDDGAITAAEIDAIDAQLMSSMRRQVPEGLCKPDGAEARLYRRKLDDLPEG